MADRATAMESEIRRHHDVEIPVEGETVAATRYEPVEYDESLPVLLMYVPYPKDDMITYGAYDPLNRYLASHGYEVVVADMVGTGASTGRFDAMFGPNEGREAAAIVEWLADRAWTNGRVGMYGKSYGGITSLAAAARRPDALDAIVPIHTPFMGYRNAYSYGGLFELQYIGTSWLTLMQALDAKPPSRRDQRGEWVDVWQTQLDATRDRDPFLFDFLDHDVDDDYWEETRIPVEHVDTPTLAIGGTRDSYTRDTVEYFEAIDAPKQMLLGPWRHTMPHRGRESAIGLRKKALAWFDHFLKDEPRAIVDEPPVQVWTESGDGSSLEDGVWRGIDRWPDATDAADTVRFALTADGLERPREYDAGQVEREYEPDYTVGVDSFQPPGAPVPARDTGEDDARSLTFESDPLDRAFDFTGTGSATVRLRTTIDDPTLSVRVVDVAPDGSTTMVTHGTRRARSRSVAELAEPVGSGETEVTIPLKPNSHCFEAGHRVRIAVASALFPEFMSTGTDGTTTLLSAPADASVVELPGEFRDDVEFEDAVEMPDPETSTPTDPERIVDSETTWERTREDIGDTATVRNASNLRLDLPHADMARETDLQVSVAADDPSSVVARSEMEWTLEYPTEEITVVASNRFDRDFAKATTKVVRDGTTVFEEHWSRPVNR
jgi:putative CocE/NonD family hydrolase